VVVKGRIAAFAAFIVILRPFTLLPPMVGIASGSFAAVGSIANQGQVSFAEIFTASYGDIILGAIMAAVLNGASNVLNQITEVELDRVNKPMRALPSRTMSMAIAQWYCAALYGIALILAWNVGPSTQREVFWCTVVAAVATFIYSVKPWYTKSRGWLANLTIAVPRGGLLKVAGWACVAPAFANPEPWTIGAIFFLFLLGAASTKDFADEAGDRQARCGTLIVRYGAERTVRSISWSFVLPWLVLPLATFPVFGAEPLLHLDQLWVLALAVLLIGYGLFIVRLMRSDIGRLSVDANHPSWKHTYLLMMLAQIGLALCYAK